MSLEKWMENKEIRPHRKFLKVFPDKGTFHYFSFIQGNSFELLGEFSHRNLAMHARGCGVKKDYKEAKVKKINRAKIWLF